jgi:5-(carboxyamino)imidazole ribonucleotide mutase
MSWKCALVMGSPSDREELEKALPYFEYFDLQVDVKVISAHRNPLEVTQFATTAREEGYRAIIAAAGMAAHLAGVIASHTTLPVLGVPLAGSFNGLDALLATVQMPAGIPVATFAVGSAGARNAAIFLAEMIAVEDRAMAVKLDEFRSQGARL